MSNINLMSEVKRGYVIFTKDGTHLGSSQQTFSYVTPGVSASSLYSRYIPTVFNVKQSPFVQERKAPQLVGNEGGDELAKPHLDPEYLDNKTHHQVGHGETSRGESPTYEDKFSKLLDKFNHPHFNTTTVSDKSAESVASESVEPEPEASGSKTVKRKIPNLKTVVVKKGVPAKKAKLTKDSDDGDFIDFTKY